MPYEPHLKDKIKALKDAYDNSVSAQKAPKIKDKQKIGLWRRFLCFLGIK